jgi:hypothetical protein
VDAAYKDFLPPMHLHFQVSRRCFFNEIVKISGFMEPEEADYRELDGPSFCQEINQAAYDLVLESLEGTRGSIQLLYGRFDF